MVALMSFIYFVLVLTIVVFIHEFGHYIVAKMCGVKIVEFSIGFGTKLFGYKRKNGEIWKVCLLPLGGYVKMYGDDNASSFGGYSKNPTEEELKWSLQYKSSWKKILVACAGPAMNFILAFALLTGIFTIKGKQIHYPIVGKIEKESIASKIGIRPGDKIISLNGNKINEFIDIQKVFLFDNNKTNKMKISFERKGKILTKTFKKEKQKLGISSAKSDFVKLGFVDSIVASSKQIWMINELTCKSLWGIIAHHKNLENIGGPIAIAKQSGKAGNGGFWSFWYFVAMISISLGIINIMPIPLLDGGQATVSFVELITRRRLPNIAYKIFVYAGIICIGLLMGLGFFNDLFINR